MPSPFRRAGVAAFWLAVLWSLVAPRATLDGQTSTAIDPLLSSAGVYLEQLGRDLDGVVFEEDYFQQSQGNVSLARRLKSDMVVLSDSAAGWVEFRDTNSVDGRPVADRQARIADIFAHPNPDALAQARRIIREGARFNLGGTDFQIDRTINLPMAALAFLRRGNQKRSTFRRDRSSLLGDSGAVVMTFQEIAQPRMIGTVDDAPARGTFWIMPDTGRVARSQLSLQTRRRNTTVTASIRVDYGLAKSLGMWLPNAMDESYVVTGPMNDVVGAISGRASYQNFRKFNVAVQEKAGP